MPFSLFGLMVKSKLLLSCRILNFPPVDRPHLHGLYLVLFCSTKDGLTMTSKVEMCRAVREMDLLNPAQLDGSQPDASLRRTYKPHLSQSHELNKNFTRCHTSSHLHLSRSATDPELVKKQTDRSPGKIPASRSASRTRLSCRKRLFVLRIRICSAAASTTRG